MARYSYKVVPAPSKGRKAAGVKGAEARFAHGLEEAINEYAAQGWEYLRADILPSEERQGLTSTATVYRSVLVFRRTETEEDAAQEAPAPVAPADPAPDPAPEPRFIRAAPPLTATRKPDPDPGADPDTEQDAPPDAEPEQPPTRREDPDATEVSGDEPPEIDETDETATPEGEDTPRG